MTLSVSISGPLEVRRPLSQESGDPFARVVRERVAGQLRLERLELGLVRQILRGVERPPPHAQRGGALAREKLEQLPRRFLQARARDYLVDQPEAHRLRGID